MSSTKKYFLHLTLAILAIFFINDYSANAAIAATILSVFAFFLYGMVLVFNSNFSFFKPYPKRKVVIAERYNPL